MPGLRGWFRSHRDRAYRAGTFPHWVKVKNPAPPGDGPDERSAQPQMTSPVTVHIRKHERVEDCGSFEVWYFGLPAVTVFLF